MRSRPNMRGRGTVRMRVGGRAGVIIVILYACILIISNLTGSCSSSVTSDGFSQKSHTCTAVSIEAELKDSGTLAVSESRTYDFTGTYELSTLILDAPEDGTARAKSVSVTTSDGTTTTLECVDFDESWRLSGGPGDGKWAYDEEKQVMYAFSDTADEEKTFTFSYAYANAATAHADIAELYWEFVGTDWDVDSKNVTLNLTLPVAEGDSVTAGEDTRAWGHASDGSGGTVSFEDDGTVTWEISKVESGEWAEMRVVFPLTWLSAEATGAADASDVALDDILAEEEEWAAQTRKSNLASLLCLVIPLLLSIAMIAAAILLFRRYGREHEPEFQGEYWRDVPDPDLHPVQVARLMRWDKEDPDDLTTELMHLSAQGVISIERATFTKERMLRADKTVDTFALRKKDASLLEDMTEIDRNAFSFVFDACGGGSDVVTLEDIRSFGEECASKFTSKMDDFQLAVSSESSDLDFYEPTGEKLKSWFVIASVFVLVVSILFSLLLANFMPLICLVPGCAVVFAFSFVMPRRSTRAVEVVARAKGLKRWFTDFTALDESVPTDAKVWGELFVYAHVLGVADKVSLGIGEVAPEVFDDEMSGGWVLWYHVGPIGGPGGPGGAGVPGGAGGTGMRPAGSGDFFGRCFSNTLDSANATLEAAKGVGNAAGSLGGFGGGLGGGFGGGLGGGGGFSAGGGGGFGGGGGGFSR